MKKLLLFLIATVTMGYSQTPASGPAVPPERNSFDVISQYGSAYTNLTGIFFQSFDSSTIVDETLADGSIVKKYTNHSFSGISANGNLPLDVSQMTHLHFDIWSPDFTSMRIKLEAYDGSGLEIDVPGGTSQNNWNSFDIPLSSFAGVNLQDLRWILPVTLNQGATLFLTNLYFYRPSTTMPEFSLIPPPRNAADVLSQFGSAYSNQTDVFFQNFDVATIEDETLLDGSVVKKYTGHNFSGISTNGNIALDASQMTYLHLDVWSPDFTSMRIKLEAFDGSGLEIDVPNGTAQGTWNSYDIPLSSFAGVNLQDLRWIIPVTLNQEATLFLTNVYFYRPSSTTPLASLIPPTRNAEDVLSQFGNAYTNLTGIFFQSFDTSTIVDETLEDGSVVKKYTNHNFSGISANGNLPLDASQMTHLHIDVWSPDFASMRIKLEAYDGSNIEIDVPGGTLQGTWNSYNIPLTSFAGVNLEDLHWIIPVTLNQDATLFLTNVYFFRPSTTMPEEALVPPARNPADVLSQYGSTYTNLADIIFANFDGSTIVDQTLNDGTVVKKYTNHSFSGISANGNIPLDASQMTHLHFDVWSSDFTSMRIKLEAFDGSNIEIDVPGGTTQGVWNSYEIPLSSFSGVNLQDLHWIIPVTFNQGATLFLNNIYFSKPASPPTASVISGSQTIFAGDSAFISVEITGGNSPFTVEYFDGISNTILTDYVSNSPILVSPNTSTNYTLVAVTDAIGQTGTGNSGTAVIEVTSTITYFLNPSGNGVWSNGIGPTIALDAIIETNLISSGNLFANNLTIAPSGSLFLSNSDNLTLSGALVNNAEASDFVVSNNANLIQTSSVANTGEITVMRTSAPIIRLDVTLWSSPVSGQNLKDFSPATLNNRFYEYDSSASTYAAVDPLTTDMVAGKGYAIRAPNNSHPTIPSAFAGIFVGAPNNGDYVMNVDDLGSRFYLVGNPYPSSLNLNDFYNNGNNHIGSTFHLYEHTVGIGVTGNNFATYNAVAGVFASADRPSNSIPIQDFQGDVKAGQGFFVEANAGSGNINFNNSMRSNAVNDVFFKVATQSIASNNSEHFKLRLTQPSAIVSEIALGFYEGATDDSDAYDSRTFSSEPLFYSLNNSEKFAIQSKSWPIENSSVFPLGFKALETGEYIISLASFSSAFESNQIIFIFDLLTNTYHNLSESPFTFTAAIGDDDNRLVVVFSSILSTENPLNTQSQTWVFPNENNLIVKVSEPHLIDSVVVYDLQGRTIFESKRTNHNELIIKELNSSNSILLVQVTLNTGEIEIVKIIF
uniref:T9SS sorting signal type C domain-containing protein n=1 Tax=Flavobacterium sp. TaxID=239 RepID=UPI00404ABB2B